MKHWLEYESLMESEERWLELVASLRIDATTLMRPDSVIAHLYLLPHFEQWQERHVLFCHSQPWNNA